MSKIFNLNDKIIIDKIAKSSKTNGTPLSSNEEHKIILTKEDIESSRIAYEESLEIKKGIEFLREEILKRDPEFFDVLKDPGFILSGWDLILAAINDGITYRKQIQEAEETLKKL